MSVYRLANYRTCKLHIKHLQKQTIFWTKKQVWNHKIIRNIFSGKNGIKLEVRIWESTREQERGGVWGFKRCFRVNTELADLAEDLSSVHSTHKTGSSQLFVTPVLGRYSTLFWPPWTLHSCTYPHKDIPMLVIKNKIKIFGNIFK